MTTPLGLLLVAVMAPCGLVLVVVVVVLLGTPLVAVMNSPSVVPVSSLVVLGGGTPPRVEACPWGCVVPSLDGDASFPLPYLDIW